MSGQRIGAMIAAIAGLVFVFVNAATLPRGIAAAVCGLGVVAFIAVMTLVVVRRGGEQRLAPAPDQRAWRTYWSMVILEVILLPIGSVTLTRLGHPELGVAWVALIVGVHFLPFANAFDVPDFRLLAWTMIVLAPIGGVLAVAVSAAAGAIVAGVLSGVALFAFALRYGANGTTPSYAITPTTSGASTSSESRASHTD
ncbi:MAG: hypothetical protein ACXVGN_07105 [Mycobacteriaceae bacterium]